MRIRIRSKLIFAISILMMVLFSIAAYIFITEKKIEIAEDIYVNSLAFSRLTASNVAGNYDLYLVQGSFVYFNREMQSVFEQNHDIASIDVVSFAGELLYDSNVDVAKKYDGAVRQISDKGFLEQVRSENISIRTKEGRTVFIKAAIGGGFDYVDKNENTAMPLELGPLIDYLVVPANEKYSVVYTLDYQNMEEKVDRMVKRIIYLAVFGIMLGMIMSFFMSSQVTKPVGELVVGVEKIAHGDFKARVYIKTHDEINFLGNAFNRMAEDLEVGIEAKLYRERVGREIELAAQIQKRLVPETVPKVEGLDIAAELIPADEIGGDIYDFLLLDKDRLLMYLGDVTGHGIHAGIVSSIASALFYGYSVEDSLTKILVEVNRVITAKMTSNMFLTLCLMRWNAIDGKFSYSSAGHEQILHYKAAEKKAGLVPGGGVALGMLKDISGRVFEREIDLKSGDFLVIYSDGITEAWNDKGENYGMDRFFSIVEKSGASETSNIMKDAILADVKEFESDYKQMDDITIIVIRKT